MWTVPVSTAPLAFPGKIQHKTGLVVHLSQNLVGPWAGGMWSWLEQVGPVGSEETLTFGGFI